MLRTVLIVLAGLLSVTSGAFAGVAVVSDGSDGGPAKILIQAAIKKGDLNGLESALARVERSARGRINDVPFVTIELNSPGGDVVEALGMGRVIYQNMAMTMVRPGQECVSACVFIFIAGAVRTPAEGASIGLHRPLLVSWRNISAGEARARYDGLMEYLHDYFRELGISDSAYTAMMQTGSYGMRYFSPAELSDLRLRGESPRWKQYFSMKNKAPVTVAVSSAPLPAGSAAQFPALPKVSETFRNIVFMPGAYHPGTDYTAGVQLPKPDFEWSSFDDEKETIHWRTSDIQDWKNFLHRVLDMLAPLWWLIALASFELMRGNFLPWPGQRRD